MPLRINPLILGFSHTRLCGTGAVDGGHVRIVPCATSTPLKQLRRGMRAELDHANEPASPGFYSVAFPKIGVKAELTATCRVGLHRYGFAAGAVPRILIDVGSLSDKEIFYTALYRSLTMPTTFNDVSGQYLGFDKRVHQADGFQYYTDMSLWDTFRTTHPLFTLLMPARHRDMLVSLVKMAEQGGNLPRWPAGAGYTNSMFGAPAEIVIAEAYLKGIRDFDVEAAYRVMRRAALEPAPPGAPYSGRRGIADSVSYGYCPAGRMEGAVSKTLEYSSTDAAIGRLAAALGHAEDAALFAQRGQYYRFFAGSSPQVGTLPNGFYWHGNQPDIHAVYRLNAAGRCVS